MSTYIKPLKIGNITLPNNLIQGPLAGISCAPFRVIAHQYGEPGLVFSEMLSAKNLIHGQQKKRYTYKDPKEGLYCMQISGNNPEDIALATKKAESLGADCIDLNCGCPQPKIRKKSSGSALLEQHSLLGEIIESMRKSTSLPISIKIRVDGFTGGKNHIAVAKIAELEGVDYLTVHGRSWQDDYSVACHLEQIAEIVSETSIPVIGNGDVQDAGSLSVLFDQTGCHGAMISRFGVGQPWLFKKIKSELAGKHFDMPTWPEQGEIFLQHVKGLIALEGEKAAILQSRRFAKYYARGLERQDCWLQSIKHTICYHDLLKNVTEFF